MANRHYGDMLVTRIIGNIFASLSRTRENTRVRALIARAERLSVSDPDAALAALEDATAVEEGNARAHGLMAEIHTRAERYDRAQAHLERSTGLAATAHTLTQLANVYRMRDDAERAEKTYRRALALDARCQLAHYNLAVLLRSQRRFAEALPHFKAAHESDPLRGVMLRTLVNALLEASEFAEASRISETITGAEPACIDAWLCLGIAHQKLHRSAQALACYDRALALYDGDAELFNNRAIALQQLERWDEAFADYDAALALEPGHVLARFHRGLARLAHHRYGAGWVDYEARLLSAELRDAPREGRVWEGQPVGGRRMLVYGEQGLGDEMMFASCVPQLVAAGARCVLECSPRLVGLFRRSFPDVTVRPAGVAGAAGDDGVGFEYQAAIGSLPRHLRKSVADFPHHAGYLRADRDRVAAWKTRLEALGPGLKVGFSWRGGTHKTRSPLRSVDLEALRPLLQLPGLRFVSLQYTSEAAAEVADANARHGLKIAHWPDAIDDYEETAALVTALDLTVSVCTAVVHLAGALGRPVWVLAPRGAEWRYGYAGCAMPWYPSALIFRQRREGMWAEPLAELACRLAELRDRGPLAPVRDAAEAANAEGVTKLGVGDLPGAQRAFEAALELVPYLAQARSNLGISLLQQGREREGEAALREATELDPGGASAWENLAVLFTRRYEHDAALAAWDEVLARNPRHANAYAAKAVLAFQEGRFDDAKAYRIRALECGADATSLGMQEAAVLAMSGDTTAAKRVLRALAHAADPHDLDWELALCALYERRWDEAWPLYEARLDKSSGASRRPYRYPAWDGERLASGSLLILGEQGPGDEIMFASCYRDAIARAGECIIECEPRLETLFARSFPDARVVGQPRRSAHPALVARADIASQVHCGSLPRFFRRSADAFPRHDGFLEADARRVDAWRRRLAAEGHERLIGISWSGGLKHTWRSLRSIQPEIFAELLRLPDAVFVSLQHDDDGTVAADLSERSGARVRVFPEAFTDFDELAALIAALDAVVTVCSTVVHLAGALGARALVLTPKEAEWRYLLEGPSMPWYPSVRLIRQERGADWAPAIAQARAALADTLESPRRACS